MGSQEFQKEYIQYLEQTNKALTEKLNNIKAYYENKVLSRDLYKNFFFSTLKDMARICTEIPQEIDLFFDKMTSAMNILNNVLLRKAEMVQLAERISKVINSECYNTNNFEMSDLNSSTTLDSEMRSVKKSRRVALMMNNHTTSTEPNFNLGKMPEMFPRNLPRNGGHQLSPIIEASPDVLEKSNTRTLNFTEMLMPVERIDLIKPFSYMSEESPKSRLKGPKAWIKSLSCAKIQSGNERNPPSEGRENSNKIVLVGEVAPPDENVDPLEGPSWLHDDKERIPSPCKFINYRRRKHRFATVFDKNEECGSSCAGKPAHLPLNEEQEERLHGDHDIGESLDDDVDHVDNTVDDTDDLVGDDVEGGISDHVLYENIKPHEDIRDFREHTKRSSENSMDLFGEAEEKFSPFEQTNTLDKRKEMKELVVKVEDCLTIQKPKSKNRGKKNSRRKKSKEGSKSPNPSEENGGRKKRKAAPTFKLVEPKLSTKLRRN